MQLIINNLKLEVNSFRLKIQLSLLSNCNQKLAVDTLFNKRNRNLG